MARHGSDRYEGLLFVSGVLLDLGLFHVFNPTESTR
jgi:hypothetical protein